ncbi:UNVERIFIED_CONTAM: hypothetical protein Slati_1414400, partial [Sesamum latifolium]
MDRNLIDAASEGALFNKTPIEARNLISIMPSNTQQFGTRYDDPPKRSNEVSMAAFDDRLNKLTSLVKKIAVEKHHVKACGICTSPEHVTDMCSTLQEPPTKHAETIGGFSGQQRRYNPFSNTYNTGWKDHSNLSYAIPAEYSATDPTNPAKHSAILAEYSAVPTKHSTILTKHPNEYSAIGVSNEPTSIIRWSTRIP